MSTDYGAWGAYNDLLAGPAGEDFVAFVKSVTGGPPARVLEFGVGSGRLALPLVAAGYDVTGVDSSAAMLELLAERDADGSVRAICGDFTDPLDVTDVDLVLIAYNALSMQSSRDAQRATLARAAQALRSGGAVIVENLTPHAVLSQVNANNQALGVKFIDGDAWLYLARYYPGEERYLARYIAFHDGGITERNGDLTLLDVESLRRLSADAGLDVAHVAGDWDGAPLTADSHAFVATLTKPISTVPAIAREERQEVTSQW